jgi:hypothetical protein|tara:strand:- start:933 stop:1211 length:279 start_codon:yes stop_codon:yes gene_type:complete
MVDTPQLQGAPITINQEDGSSKVYDTGLLSPEAQQAVDMIAFIGRLRQVLDSSGQVFSNVVTSNLTEEAMVEELATEAEVVEEDNTDEEDTK